MIEQACPSLAVHPPGFFYARRQRTGRLALARMLGRGRALRPPPSASIRSRRSSRIITPTAKSVIWLFMEGGPSHIDLFDPKPKLDELAGQPMPASFGKVDHRHGHRQQHAHAVQAHVQAVRAERHLGVRLVSGYREARRRYDRDPLLLGRWPESRRLGLPDEHRLDPRRPALAGRVGHLRTRHREPRICRRSSF